MERMARLEGQVALVTGGASGLGEAIAHRLVADGATVVVTDIDAERGSIVASEGGFTFLAQDVTDEQRWAEIVTEVELRHGRLDLLVNNAGILGPTDRISPEDTPLEWWRRIFAVNLDGVFLGCRAALPAMRRNGGGSIVNISSVAGLLATPNLTAYGCSKAAVRQLTQSVAQYAAEQKLKVRCNSVHPGDVRTPLWDAAATDRARRKGTSFEDEVNLGRKIAPMGDFTLPSDIAGAVSFLASEDARRITGAMLVVDGGLISCSTYHLALRD